MAHQMTDQLVLNDNGLEEYRRNIKKDRSSSLGGNIIELENKK